MRETGESTKTGRREKRSQHVFPRTSKAGRRVSPLKVIRRHCLECCGNSPTEVERCSCPDCLLWPWRFGMRPETAAKHGKPVDPETYVTDTEKLVAHLEADDDAD